MSIDPLKGKVFVFTGDMNVPREEAQNKIMILGARFTTAVSSKTTYLVAGSEPGPSKIAKAKQNGISILNEDQFIDLLNKYKNTIDSTINIAVDHDNHSNKPDEICNSIIESNKDSIKKNMLPWAEKYRPKKREDLIGNPGIINELDDFLKGKTKSYAALLSGSPGLGKTTAARLLSELNNFEIIEYNASDFRNKSSIVENISSRIDNSTLGKNLKLNKKVLIMDEVDGMSTSDRGGIQELLSLIKKKKALIICICNDRSNPKMASLGKNCLDLRFRKLDSRTILPKIKQILSNENKSLPDGIINEIITNAHGDMRYVLNTIQKITMKNEMKLNEINKEIFKKVESKSMFELLASMFSVRSSIKEKNDLFFQDYNFLPLFIHENYLKCKMNSKIELAAIADSISFSDILDSKIHGPEQEWSLLPFFAFYSCIFPSKGKALTSRIDFPQYLAQLSKKNKNKRIISEFCQHSYSLSSMVDMTMYIGQTACMMFMKKLEEGNIGESIKILKELNVSKDDMFNIEEVIRLNISKNVPAKIKTALTKEYNKTKPNFSNIKQEEKEEEEFDD